MIDVSGLAFGFLYAGIVMLIVGSLFKRVTPLIKKPKANDLLKRLYKPFIWTSDTIFFIMGFIGKYIFILLILMVCIFYLFNNIPALDYSLMGLFLSMPIIYIIIEMIKKVTKRGE